MQYVLLHTYWPKQNKFIKNTPTLPNTEVLGISFEPNLLLAAMHKQLDTLLRRYLDDEASDIKQAISWGIDQQIYLMEFVMPVCLSGELYGYRHVIDIPGHAPLLVESYEVLAFMDGGDPKIYVEVWKGVLQAVYTDISGNPQLIKIKTGDDNETQMDRDNSELMLKQLQDGKIRNIEESENWVLTDDACCQCCRQITSKAFELIQVCRMPEEYGVSRAVINLDDFSLEEWEHYLQLYGHKDLRSFIGDYGNELNLRILAEYIFETNWLTHLLEDRFSTKKDAAVFVTKIVDCNIDVENIS